MVLEKLPVLVPIAGPDIPGYKTDITFGKFFQYLNSQLACWHVITIHLQYKVQRFQSQLRLAAVKEALCLFQNSPVVPSQFPDNRSQLFLWSGQHT